MEGGRDWLTLSSVSLCFLTAEWGGTRLVFGGDLGDDLDNGTLKLFNADVLKDDCSLGEQPHVRGHFFTLWPQDHISNH